MLIHFARIVVATLGLLLLTFLPHLPGRYDRLAVAASLMAQVFGVTSLILVPIGGVWIACHWSSRLRRHQWLIALIALIASGPVTMLVALAAWVSDSVLLAGFGLTLGLVGLARAGKVVRRLKNAPTEKVSAAATFAFFVPVALFAFQTVLAERVEDWSRRLAIQNAAPVIQAIEAYHRAQGRYPPSLHAVWDDERPDIIGISGYLYEPSGNAYNLFFEQPSFTFGTREFVMYNPLDLQAFTAHRRDILELSPQGLALDQTRGHYAAYPVPGQLHWKRFLFD
jgi:hypothetical protein